MTIRRFAAALGLLVVSAIPAMAKDWIVDPAKSKLAVTFHQGSTAVEAGFDRFQATIRFDPADLANALVEVQVDLASFRSGEDQRDAQAKGADFLDADSVTSATYRTTSFRSLGNDVYQVDGELTLKGVTKQLSHEATISVDGDRARAEGVVPLTRTDFNVGTGQFATGSMVGLDVEVGFTLEATSG